MFEGWKKRHQNKTSFTLHMIGIPMTILAIVPLVVAIAQGPDAWYLVALALFIVGYALQFIGHGIEGNDAGEMILIKKLLGKPYIAIVEKDKSNDPSKK
jgi:uncharacterized membrane protein YGL010W